MGKVSALPLDTVLDGTEKIYIVVNGGSYSTTLDEILRDIVPVPAGGTTGQVLGKLLDDDYETGWIDQTGEGGGGSVEDGSIANAKLVNMAGGTVKGRLTTDGSGAPRDLTADEWLTEVEVERGATGDQTGAEIGEALVAAAAEDSDLAASLGQAMLLAINAYAVADPATCRALLGAAGIVWTQGVINTNQVLVGAVDGTTGVQAADTTNGTPSIAGIVAGSAGMVATSDIMASVWAPRQATLVTGALTFNAAQGLQWTVAAGANNITVAESCWDNIPLDKPAILEVVAGGTARTITFTDGSGNLVKDNSGSPWDTTSSGTRVRFELGWLAEGSAPTVKSKRYQLFLGYLA